MWIEIPDEIDEYLSNIDDAMSKASLAINALLESMLRGQHIVFASRGLLNKISNLSYINPSNKAFICWIKQKYIYLYGCRDIIEYKISVTTDTDVISIVDNIYKVPLEFFYDFRESKLLTENESDGEFFIDIYNYIKKNKKIGDFYSVKFENDSCHGANVASKITQNAKENRIAICILDSDREMKGSKVGATYIGARRSFNKVKNNHIMLLEKLDAREKENLFPPIIYMLLCEEKKVLLMVLHKFIEEEKIIKYFDIKDGIKYKKYKINGWESYYKAVIDELIRAGIYKLPQQNEEEKDDFICIEGVGEKICDVVCKVLLEEEVNSEEILNKRGMSEEKKEKVREIRKSLKDILPEYMYTEWEQIHKLLFSWGCCISENKLPNYQMKEYIRG